MFFRANGALQFRQSQILNFTNYQRRSASINLASRLLRQQMRGTNTLYVFVRMRIGDA